MGKSTNEQSILDTNFKRVQQNLLSHLEDMIPNDITKFPEIEKRHQVLSEVTLLNIDIMMAQ